MTATLSFEYRFTQGLANRATSASVRLRRCDLNAKFRRVLPSVLAIEALAGVLIALGYTTGEFGETEAWLACSVFGGTLAAMLMLQALAIVSLELRGRSARRQLRVWGASLSDPLIRWSFSEEGFRIRTSETERPVPWKRVRAVLTDSEFWIFRIARGPELFLPAEHLTVEIRDAIRSRTPWSVR